MRDEMFLSASPESAGIPSSAILEYLDALEAGGVPMHGLLLFRHGRLLAEGYWKPFDRARRHRLYSCSKSFVSIAIGFLAEEGRIGLHDPIVGYFPESLPAEGVHPYLAEATIRDLLRMASPHPATVYRMTMDDWVKPFFTTPPQHRPGSVFAYDTSATHTLGALVQKLTGLSFLDYLRPRLLDPIGFTQDAYCISDPMGHAWGGSGVVCTPRDFARVAMCCLRQGVYEGKQLIPAWYVKEATSMQMDNFLAGRNPDMGQGYGYQFWRTRNNGFTFLGMGGQIALCLPDQDLLLVLTGDDQYVSNQYVVQFGAFWDKVYARLSDRPLGEDTGAQEALARRLEGLALEPVRGAQESPVLKTVQGRVFRLDENEMNVSRLRLTPREGGGTLEYVKDGQPYAIAYRYGVQALQMFPECGYEAAISGAWNGDRLNISCQIIDDHCATLRMSLAFTGDAVTLAMRKVAEGILHGYEGIASGRMMGDGVEWPRV